MSDDASAGPGPAARPATGVALDIQVLQVDGRRKAEWPGWPGWPPGSTPLDDIQAHVRAYAAALARTGSLAAALMAPEYPVPRPVALPDELSGGDALRWDCRQEVRRLLADAPLLVHHVPVPFLDTDWGDPGGRVVSADWVEAGVPTVVTVFDLDPLEGAGGGSPSRQARYRARAEWVGQADLIVAATARAAEQVVAVLGYPGDRVVTLPAGPADRTPLTLPAGPADRARYDELALGVLRALDRRAGDRCRPGRRPPALPTRIGLVGPFPPHGGGIGAYNRDVLSALAARPAADRAGPLRLDAVNTAAAGWGSPEWRPPGGVGLIHPDSLGTDLRSASYDHLVYTVGNSSGHLITIETALRHPGWLWLHETRLPALATTALDGLGDDEFRARMDWLLERAYPGRSPQAAARAAGRSHLALVEAGVGLTAPLVGRSAGVFVNSTAARHFLLLDLPPLAWHPPVHVLAPGCPPLRPVPPGDARRTGGGRPLAVAFGVVSMSKRPDLLVDAAAAAGVDLAFVGPCPAILAELIGDRARHLGAADRVRVMGAVSDDEWWAWMARATVAVQLREQSSGEISAAVLDALAAGTPVVTNLPSAADYPEGTVELLPSGPGAPPDPAEVATALDRLCSDPGALGELGRAGRRYAAGNQMSDLAGALLGALAAG